MIVHNKDLDCSFPLFVKMVHVYKDKGVLHMPIARNGKGILLIVFTMLAEIIIVRQMTNVNRWDLITAIAITSAKKYRNKLGNGFHLLLDYQNSCN